MNEILLLDKPMGWTSHDLVDAVRRRRGIRRVGHAGTLDPRATGLMILLLGEATSRAAEFSLLDKGYRGSIRLGVETDSWDLDGKVLRDTTASLPDLDEKRIRDMMRTLLGVQFLAPPVFSAIKKGGVKACDSARRGETIVLDKREMRIDRFELEKFEFPEIYFDLECSKGTYVRSLAQALGQKLGCPAVLSSLVRTRIGPHRLCDAKRWDE